MSPQRAGCERYGVVAPSKARLGYRRPMRRPVLTVCCVAACRSSPVAAPSPVAGPQPTEQAAPPTSEPDAAPLPPGLAIDDPATMTLPPVPGGGRFEGAVPITVTRTELSGPDPLGGRALLGLQDYPFAEVYRESGGLGEISDGLSVHFDETERPWRVAIYADSRTTGQWLAGIERSARYAEVDELLLAGARDGNVVGWKLDPPAPFLPPPLAAEPFELVADLALVASAEGISVRALPRGRSEPWRIAELGELDAHGLAIDVGTDCRLPTAALQALDSVTRRRCDAQQGILHRTVFLGPDAAIGPALALATAWHLPEGCTGALELRPLVELPDSARSCAGAASPDDVEARLATEARKPSRRMSLHWWSGPPIRIALGEVNVDSGEAADAIVARRILLWSLEPFLKRWDHVLEAGEGELHGSFEVAADGAVSTMEIRATTGGKRVSRFVELFHEGLVFPPAPRATPLRVTYQLEVDVEVQ